MKLNDVCLFVSSVLLSEYITSLECEGKFRIERICQFLKINKQFCIQTSTMYNIPGVLLTKLTKAVYFYQP